MRSGSISVGSPSVGLGAVHRNANTNESNQWKEREKSPSTRHPVDVNGYESEEKVWVERSMESD